MGTTASRMEGGVAGGAVGREGEDEDDFKKSAEKSSEGGSSSDEKTDRESEKEGMWAEEDIDGDKPASEDDAVAVPSGNKRTVEEAAALTSLHTTFEDVSGVPSSDLTAPAKQVVDAALQHASAGENGAFGSQHLACVLSAAVASLKDMKDLLTYVKTKSEAFQGVKLSCKSDGTYSKMQIAERIAECTPEGVTNAEELLSWLVVSAQTRSGRIRRTSV